MPPRVNAKAQAGRERKAEQKALKDAEAARKREEQEAKEWQKGANTKGAARAEAQASKADEEARKRREKAALLAEEEASTVSGKPKKTMSSSKTAKGSKKKKDDLSLLEDALVGDAEKKQKKKRAAERAKQQQQQATASVVSSTTTTNVPVDPLLANTQSMIGTNDDELVGRHANKAAAATASGMDAALDSLLLSEKTPDAHPEKRVKALHRAFEERMMPIVKEEYPGLRLTQYKEKIFQLWKKSPENPMNQQQQQQQSP